jgi:hypothetical protein
MVTNTGT